MTSRHLCEFYMLEGEVVLDTLDELMDVVEDGIRSVLTKMLGEGKRAEGIKRDLGALGEDGIEHLRSTAEKPFHRLDYSDAIQQLVEQHAKTPFESTPDWNEGLPTEQEKWLASQYGPTFITHYPKHLKPFYMLPSSADPSFSPCNPSGTGETVACFDLLFPGIGELAGGSMREHRLTYLEAALDAHGLDKGDYGWYLDLRRYGSVPHGGWGMGWDRWISWVTGVGNLRDVVAFPRWKGHCRY
jgi:asparaginyl-tRNA synthetase